MNEIKHNNKFNSISLAVHIQIKITRPHTKIYNQSLKDIKKKTN